MADQPASDPKDVELEVEISRKIRAMGSHIHVSVKGGNASLSGSADDFETKRAIGDIAKNTHGIHKITNNIRVFPS